VSVTDWQYIRVPQGNSDGDGDVDLFDYGKLLPCLMGPGTIPVAQDCGIFDAEADDDVDLADFALFQRLFTGSDR
jgi:hypothetical protein